LVELNQFALNMPDMKGFHTQEVPLSKEKTFEVERRNGINYNTCVWSQYVLFPQQSGKLEIPALKAEAVVLQDNGSDDPFDAMLNGNGKVPVKKFIPTPKITIDVMPLPSKPDNFSGAVGDFDIKSEVNTTKLKENETLTLKITVEGNGNMKLLTAPKVEVPSELEAYDPKVTDNTELTPNGVKGNKTFEYMFIPRSKGEYTIPAVEFVYFDLKTKRYKTVKSRVFTIHVEKGDGTSKSNATADYTKRDDDIHSIKLGDEDLYPINDNLFGSFTFYLGFIIPLVVFIIAYFVIRKIMADNANVTKKRKKGASKLANKRLLAASEMMNRQDEAFFDEILRSLSGYVADKFNIPTVDMTKENIIAKLSEAGVSADVANELVDVLDECQFAKFAPGDADDKMQSLYGKASDIINKLDNLLSK
ncbi:MAG: protein BatD, partial [Bacteroidaceae bacterium]|nr:protein BatD [Bacteroidaceae bacterium]